MNTYTTQVTGINERRKDEHEHNDEFFAPWEASTSRGVLVCNKKAALQFWENCGSWA